jgi:hypothetical protein
VDDPQITLDDIRAEMPPAVQVMLDQAIQAALNTKLKRALADALNAQNRTADA